MSMHLVSIIMKLDEQLLRTILIDLAVWLHSRAINHTASSDYFMVWLANAISSTNIATRIQPCKMHRV